MAASHPTPARAQPLPETPRLTLDPTCATVTDEGGLPVQVTARGYSLEAGRAVNLYFAGQQAPAPADVVTVGPNGYFEVAFAVTLPVSDPTFWSVDVYYADDPSREIPLVSAGIAVPCPDPRPSISVTPDCADATLPIQIRVTGSGFLPDFPIVVTVTDLFASEPVYGGTGEVPVVDPNTVSIDVEATLPGPGAYRVVAVQIVRGEIFDRSPNTAIAYLVAPCSQLTLVPTCGPIGAGPDRYLLQVIGSGFLARYPMEIVFDFGGQSQYFSANVAANADGTFGPFEVQPYARAGPQTYTVAVTQSNDGPILHTTFATFTVPCPVTAVTLDPSCVSPQFVGETPRTFLLNVSGTGLEPNQPATVTFDPDLRGGAEFVPETTTVTANPDGTIQVPLTVGARPAGAYRVVVQQALRGTEISADFNFPCRPPNARMRATPNCGPAAPGEPQAYSIELAGRGFIPGQVQIVFDVDGTPEPLPPATANDNGRFSVTISPTGRDIATYRIAATQADARQTLTQVLVEFTVECDSEPTPRLMITPSTASPGFVVTVRGIDFPAGAAIDLYWSTGIGAHHPIQVAADASGGFVRQVLIFNHDFAGLREMTAGTPADANAFPEATDGLLVTPGKGSPPTYVTFGESPEGAPIIDRR